MRISAIPARELSSEQIAAWAALQSADHTVDSPFFRPEFTQAVAEVLKGIEVAVLEDGGSFVGFLPFLRSPSNVGWPLPLSEFQGLVLRPGLAVEAKDLVHKCRLSAWNFDQAIAGQAILQPHHWVNDASPYIDTSMGFDAYRSQRSRAGSETLSKTLQKLRKLEREVGPVRFEMASTNERVLATLVTWKTEQYHRTNHFNIFARDWVRQLFQRLLRETDVPFAANMSAIYVKDELQAVVYYLRSGHVLHTWASAHGPECAKYSPGYQLLVKIIQAAQGLGIERIDLSKGHHEPYKRSFMSGAIPLASGSVDPRASRLIRYAAQRAHFRVRESPLRNVAAIPWRWIQRAVRELQFP